MRIRIGASLACAGIILSGCAGAGAGPLGIGAIIGDRNLASAEPLFSKQEQNCLGSADLLIGALFAPSGVEAGGIKKKAKPACARIRANLRYLMPASGADGIPTYEARQRNEIIDSLLAASNQKCTRYAALLKNADGAMNSGLSVGAIVTGGLGSILGGVNTAKALAGSSSILSGSRAALNDTYLSNQTIHVLTAAFEKARRTQRRVITNREACTVEQYSVARGIEDAFSYHNSCSLVAGLAEAALSIERSENPGLDTMRTQINELSNLRRQMAEFSATGPITPIAASPKPVSFERVAAADKAVVEAQTAMDASEKKLPALQAAEILAKAKPGDAPAITAASDALKKGTEELMKLTAARDDAARIRDGEVRALVQAAGSPAPVTERETRVCPFDV